MHCEIGEERGVADDYNALVQYLRIAIDRGRWGELPVYHRVAGGRGTECYLCHPEIALHRRVKERARRKGDRFGGGDDPLEVARLAVVAHFVLQHRVKRGEVGQQRVRQNAARLRWVDSFKQRAGEC
jgi:hypothetical protein